MPAEDVEALNDMETAMAAGGLGPWIDNNTRLNGCFLEKPPRLRSKNLTCVLKTWILMNATASIPGNGKTTVKEKQQPVYGQWSE